MLQIPGPRYLDASLQGLKASRRSHYRARYYDPTSGRFLSEDPIRFTGGAQFYRYALNAPTNHRYPTDLKPGGRPLAARHKQGGGPLVCKELGLESASLPSDYFFKALPCRGMR